MSTDLPTSMERHPDIIEMRAKSELAALAPRSQVIEAFAVGAGLFLAISPWVVGFNSSFQRLAVCNLVLGLAYTLLMAGFGPVYERTHARAWAAALVGVFTIIAPWAVNGGAHVRATILTNVITGGVMTCLALATVAAATIRVTMRSRASAR
ncbi:SPW repeat protein [Catenulispora subtropica]|uniref:SPW repeat protein n=1 Tax=Catenulispora subtropica TaxID=450798 RepID=UPI0031D8E7B6